MNYGKNGWAPEALTESDDEFFSEYDDDTFRESDDEFYSEADDEFYGAESDEEFLPSPGAAIGGAIQGIRNLIRKKPSAGKGLNSYLPGPGFLSNPKIAGQYGVSVGSQLSGILNTNRGQFSFALPQNVATKEDVKKLSVSVATDIKKVNEGIAKNASVIKTNVAAIRKLNDDLKAFDKKNSAVELKQTQLITKLGKNISRLKKENEAVKSQLQMTSMMSLISQPKLESITYTPTGGGTETTVTVTKSKFKTDLLPLMLMMSTPSGEGSSSNNMFSNPMMLFFMMEAFKG
jgi:hypothetical protein